MFSFTKKENYPRIRYLRVKTLYVGLSDGPSCFNRKKYNWFHFNVNCMFFLCLWSTRRVIDSRKLGEVHPSLLEIGRYVTYQWALLLPRLPVGLDPVVRRRPTRQSWVVFVDAPSLLPKGLSPDDSKSITKEILRGTVCPFTLFVLVITLECSVFSLKSWLWFSGSSSRGPVTGHPRKVHPFYGNSSLPGNIYTSSQLPWRFLHCFGDSSGRLVFLYPYNEHEPLCVVSTEGKGLW